MRVDRLAQNYDIQIKYTHFPLHPETPEEGLTLEQPLVATSTSRPRRLA